MNILRTMIVIDIDSFLCEFTCVKIGDDCVFTKSCFLPQRRLVNHAMFLKEHKIP